MTFKLIRVHALFSLSLFRNFLPKNPLSVCNSPDDFGEGTIEEFGPFSISWWVFTFDFVCKDYFECVLFRRR